MASKNGEKEALEELQRRKWTLPCLFDRQDREGTGGRVTGGQMDVSVPHLSSLACPARLSPEGYTLGMALCTTIGKATGGLSKSLPLEKQGSC